MNSALNNPRCDKQYSDDFASTMQKNFRFNEKYCTMLPWKWNPSIQQAIATRQTNHTPGLDHSSTMTEYPLPERPIIAELLLFNTVRLLYKLSKFTCEMYLHYLWWDEMRAVGKERIIVKNLLQRSKWEEYSPLYFSPNVQKSEFLCLSEFVIVLLSIDCGIEHFMRLIIEFLGNAQEVTMTTWDYLSVS